MVTVVKENIYTRITTQIVEQMSRGVIPWVQPWTTSLPFNVVSSRAYKGINALSTFAHRIQYSYACPGYLTFKQTTDLGGYVKRGERGAPIILYRPVNQKDEHAAEERPRFVARGYTVFNLEQLGGLDRLTEIVTHRRPAFEPLVECERVLVGTGAVIRQGAQASYSPTRDEITLPPRSAFAKAGDFYSTAYHELAHWSGAVDRLHRDLSGGFGSTAYAREELTAELAAAFLAARTGIEHVTQAASYLDHWLRVLRNDHRLLFVAAKQATEAADFIYPNRSDSPAESI